MIGKGDLTVSHERELECVTNLKFGNKLNKFNTRSQFPNSIEFVKA